MARRLATVGRNVMREVVSPGPWTILVRQLQSLVVALLAAAAGLALVLGDVVEAVAVGVVLALNTAIGFAMEWRAVQSMEALREVDHAEATVRRNGTPTRIDAENLVPGDVVLLDEGDLVPADLRILESAQLRTDESALTGESVPVDKHTDSLPEDCPLADRSNLAYKGTAVTSGTGEGVVIGTGMHTEIGAISTLVEEADDEATPLEERLDQLARSLVGVVLLLAAAVSVMGIVGGRDVRLMIETGIALAVAAIPEGLPVVATIALARGLRRMARRNALVRRLSSVETLGATGVICTDKTGTLTENQMTVMRLVVPEGDSTGGPEASGMRSIHLADDTESSETTMPVPPLPTWITALCTTATLSSPDAPGDAPTSVGDPMEIALLRFARDAGSQPGADAENLEDRWPEVGRVAFNREAKKMATLHRLESLSDTGERHSPGGSADEPLTLIAVKGAPEAVLDGCTAEATSDLSDPRSLLGALSPLDDDRRSEWLAANDALARQGLRVLGLAARVVPSADATPEHPETVYQDLAFAGLVGLVDPPREDVRTSIGACQNAGIRVVMVTGDQPETARYVADAVGLADADEEAVHGRDFDRLHDADRERLAAASIFARVSPRQKLDLIDLHQESGHVVAMTGDGVNDAPALKSADIGVAMGQRGTQVAREAADVVLQDDAFSTIVAAVEEGRTIFGNIRSFVRYLLSCNVAEVMIVGGAALAGLTLPILPLQILFLNLVTDVFPALALGVGESEEDVMTHPPRPASEPVVGRRHWWGIAAFSAVIGASVIGALLVARHALGYGPEMAVTVSFLTLAFGQLVHVFNMRSPGAPLIRNAVTRNPYVWSALLLCTVLLFGAVYAPPIAEVLSLSPLPTAGWLLVAIASLIPLVLGQIGLSIVHRTEKRRARSVGREA